MDGEMHSPRHDWTAEQVRAIHDLPLTELLLRAQQVHRENHPPDQVQLCTLLSVKTGGCQEDCAYCPQSAHYQTNVDRAELLSLDDVVSAAARASTKPLATRSSTASRAARMRLRMSGEVAAWSRTTTRRRAGSPPRRPPAAAASGHA